MPRRRRRLSRLTAALAAVLLAAGVGAGVGTAHAKSLGNLTSQTLLGKFSPTDAITDKFDETNNLSLDGTTDTNNDTWNVGPGGFKIVSSGGKGVVQASSAPSEATVPGTVNASVGGDLHISGKTSSFGLILNAAGAPSYAATLLLCDRGAKLLTLERISPAGGITVLGNTYRFTPGNNYLRLTYLNGVYTAYVDGVSRITYTEVGALRTEVESYSRIGFGSVSDTTSTFDNFQAYAL